MSTGNLNDGLIAFKDGKPIILRVPYPMGFYAKGFDGRIDDPNAGWKGRGLWAANGDRTPWLIEGGKGTKRWPRTSSFARTRWRSNRALQCLRLGDACTTRPPTIVRTDLIAPIRSTGTLM